MVKAIPLFYHNTTGRRGMFALIFKDDQKAVQKWMKRYFDRDIVFMSKYIYILLYTDTGHPYKDIHVFRINEKEYDRYMSRGYIDVNELMRVITDASFLIEVKHSKWDLIKSWFKRLFMMEGVECI